MEDSRQEIKALTGLRAVAAFWVLSFHLSKDLKAALPEGTVLINLVSGIGYLGVDLFFILSGFIISYNYAQQFDAQRSGALGFGRFDAARYLRFLWARLARIYPVHLFTLLVLAAFIALAPAGVEVAVSPPDRYAPERWIESALMLHGWAFPIGRSWNVPSWSISAEWLAYLAFPLAALAAAAIRKIWAAQLAIVVLIGLLALSLAMTDYPETMAYGLPRIAVEFPLGCLLYRLYRQRAASGALLGVVAPALLTCVALLVLAPGFSRAGAVSLFVLMPSALAALIYLLASDRGSAFARWLARPAMRYWGRVSYSLYMVHFVVIIMVHRYLPTAELAQLPLELRLAAVAGMTATILLAAMATYHFVEEPSRRWMRRLWPPTADQQRSGPRRESTATAQSEISVR
jgi:peptidoglycan/LPS O-acetylase OafA/YrhL